MNIKRRDFLKGMAAGAVSMAGMGLFQGTAFAEESAEAPAEAKAADWRTAPAPITDTAATYIADVVIVGAGNAGMSAGMAAVQAGADTIIVEKMSAVATGRSWFGALGSKYQKEAGIEIDKFEVIEELAKYADHKCDMRLIKLWADESGKTADWIGGIMESLGFEFKIEDDIGEGGGYYKTFPICHMMNSLPGTEGLCRLQASEAAPAVADFLPGPFEAAGGKIMYNTAMEQLIQNENGRVIGIICRDSDGDYIEIYGRKGVLLCTGGYAYNEEMMRSLNPYAVRHCTALQAYPGNTGDAIRAATWIGAAMDENPTCMVFDRGGVPAGVPGGGLYVQSGAMTHIGSQPFLKVNHDGERFTNESIPYDYMYHAANKETVDTYCMIMDSNWKDHVKQFHTLGCSRLDYSPTSGLTTLLFTKEFTDFFWENVLMPAGIMHKADTLEELADKLLLPRDTFMATVKRYNELAEKGYDEDFGKEAYRMIAIDKGPFYGCTLGGQLLCTLDGLRINTKMQVKKPDGSIIEGLYAAGNDAGGFFNDNYPERIPGVAVGRSLTFGRIAGETMAASEAAVITAVEKAKVEKVIVAGDGNGTYTAVKNGIGGPVEVSCTFENGVLVDAAIVGDDETPSIGGAAIPKLLEALISAGNPNIDAISSATITSTAVIEAAKECFALAGVAY